MGFDKNFALNDDGTCPRCGEQGVFYVSKGGKNPGSAFEKCNSCDVMSSSKRPAGYTPRTSYNQQSSYSAPAPPPPFQPQSGIQYTNVRNNSNAWSPPTPTVPSAPQYQGTTQTMGQPSPQGGATGQDIQQLSQQIGQLTAAINHLTNAIYESDGNNKDLLKALLQALDAMSSKLGGLEEQYENMQ